MYYKQNILVWWIVDYAESNFVSSMMDKELLKYKYLHFERKLNVSL